MKHVFDGLLHLLRSLVSYVLFYLLATGAWGGGFTSLGRLLAAVLAVELLFLISGWLMKKLFGFDPDFMQRMPVLAYAVYRMVLDLVFLIFLFSLLGYHLWLVIAVGIWYLVSVLWHYSRQNRRMIEGHPV